MVESSTFVKGERPNGRTSEARVLGRIDRVLEVRQESLRGVVGRAVGTSGGLTVFRG
jgi:hypothetical protein